MFIICQALAKYITIVISFLMTAMSSSHDKLCEMDITVIITLDYTNPLTTLCRE